jgi:hypothetical protein
MPYPVGTKRGALNVSGVKRKIGLIVIAIMIGGVIVGFVGNANRSLQDNTFPGISQGGSVFGVPAGLQSSGAPIPNDNSYGLGPMLSTVTSVNQGVTVALGTTVSATETQQQPSTIVIKSNSQGSSQSSAGSFSTNSSSSTSGFIEFFSNVTISVSSTQTSLNTAISIAYTYGGYVAFSSYSNTSSIAVLRIPASNYESALSGVEALGNLTGFQSNSNDVSVQYTNLNATLQSLLTEQASLLRLENKSTSLNSTLLIENEIQGINAQINEVQSEILQTRTLIDYSTITVTLERHQTTTVAPLSLKLIATPKSGMSPLAVTFNSIIAGGSGPYIANYNFGDGTSYQGQTLIHTFYKSGTYNVTVTATDSNGSVKEAWSIIQVSAAPSSSQFSSFAIYVAGLLTSVVEGIVEVAVVVLPITLVIAVVILPFRNKFRTMRKERKTE